MLLFTTIKKENNNEKYINFNLCKINNIFTISFRKFIILNLHNGF